MRRSVEDRREVSRGMRRVVEDRRGGTPWVCWLGSMTPKDMDPGYRRGGRRPPKTSAGGCSTRSKTAQNEREGMDEPVVDRSKRARGYGRAGRRLLRTTARVCASRSKTARDKPGVESGRLYRCREAATNAREGGQGGGSPAWLGHDGGGTLPELNSVMQSVGDPEVGLQHLDGV